jgi:16S rRNA G966 N2-methylase RsmD
MDFNPDIKDNTDNTNNNLFLDNSSLVSEEDNIGLLDNSSYVVIYRILNNYLDTNNIETNINFEYIYWFDSWYYFFDNNKIELDIKNGVRNEIYINLEELGQYEEQLEEDAWDISINDNKFYINNRIARVFPQMKNFSNYGKLKIDDDSFSYITIREIAEIISKIISHHLLQFNINPQRATIIDYTSGVGGNVLSFSKYFNQVYAVELLELRAEYLKNNIDVYGYKNIHVINESAIDYNENSMINVNPNVIFVDPPWGGADYKNIDMLTLKLGDILIEQFVLNIIDKFSSHYKNLLENISDINERQKITFSNTNNKLIVLKLPKNYDIENFYNFIKNLNSNYYLSKIYLYILNKMLIVIVELYFIGF